MATAKRRPGSGMPRTVRIPAALLKVVGAFRSDPVGWFHTPNEVFGLRKPIELLGTDDEWMLRNTLECAKLGMFT